MNGRARLVTDASVWIDLAAGGLVESAFELPFLWVAPDFVIDELRDPDGRGIIGLGLRKVDLTPQQLAEVAQLATERPGLSVPDCSVLVWARDSGSTIVTSDGVMRRQAEQRGHSIHGTLWVLDQMVCLHVVSPGEAARALQAMLSAGSRLPADECRRRLDRWAAPGR